MDITGLRILKCSRRVYPLRNAVYKSYYSVGFKAFLGLDVNLDGNNGFSEIRDNRWSGVRQIVSE
ncbi:hypothetical protein LX36DRAFT_651195 [Colletotrichum falcatum]|nr:hypothetical protein LX36DRAFT_651195 [Colletotrichum falcatum]